jgi:hypothetical protein
VNQIDKIPKKNSELAWRMIEGEVVLIPLVGQPKEGEKINLFNATGSRIWELIDGRNSISDIVEKITGEYELDIETARFEIECFINTLAEKKLIV